MRLLTLCLLLVASTQVYAQKDASLRLHLQGYNFVFPAAEVAYEYPFYTKPFGESGKKLQAIIAPTADVYFYRGNHTGIGINGDLSVKYTTSKGFEYQIFGSYGLLRTILAGKTYELNDNGEFESSSLKGNWYSQWKTGFGFGKRLANKPISINFRAGVREARLPGAFIVPSVGLGVNWFL